MTTGLARLIRICLYSNTCSMITSKIMTKVIHENLRRARKVRTRQQQVGQEAQIPVPP